MASTYSTNLKIELMGVGDQSNTWGNTNNTNLGTALEQAIVGYGNPNFATDADLTISLTDSNATQTARCFALNVTSSGSLSTTRNLIVPTIQKPYLIYNATTGGQSIVVKTSAGTGVTVPNGARTLVYVDGTNVVSEVSNLPSLTLNTALAATSGGTGQSSYTIGDILYASTSSALSKLADVATGNALISGGVGVAPAWGKIDLATHITGTLPVANGGTGQVTYTNGQLLIGNTTGNTLTKATLTAGTGITITNGSGSITIDGNTGTVTSVSGAGTVNGITLTGTVTSTGSLTLGGTLSGVSLTTQVTGTLPVANGGSGATTLTGVLKGNGTSAFTASNVSLTSEVTGTLPVVNGGTGATSLTANNVILGNGTSAVQVVAPGTSGNVLTSNGTTWQSTAPAVASVNGQTGAVATTTHLGIGCTMVLWNFSDTAVASGSTAIPASSLGYATSAGGGFATSAVRSGNVTAPGAATNGPNTAAVTGTWQSMSPVPARDYDGGANTTTATPGLFVRVS